MREGVLSDQDLVEVHQSVKRAWEIVCKVDRERDVFGRPVQRAMGQIDRIWRWGTEQAVLEENDLTHDDALQGVTDADAYLARLLERTKVLGGVAAAPIATLLLGSPDPEWRCNLRHLPQSAVTVERCLAHVAPLNLPIDRDAESRVARLVALTLLNCVTSRHARVPSSAVKPVLDAVEPVKVASQDPIDDFDDQSLAPPGRRVAGFAQCMRLNYFYQSDGSRKPLAIGTPLLMLVPTPADLKQTNNVPVVWDGEVVRLTRDDVAPIRRNEYLEGVRRKGLS